MSAGMDLEFVREHYEQMSDNELIYLVTQNGSGLTPEALQIAKKEVAKRKLHPGLSEALDMQNKEITIDEVDVYCDIIQQLDCPICHSSQATLNATQTGEVMSFIIFSRYERQIHVACPECLDKLNNAAVIKTVVLGWWGFPSGIINSLRAIALNFKSKSTNHLDKPNIYLKGFVLGKIGEISAYKGDRKRLQEVIAPVKE